MIQTSQATPTSNPERCAAEAGVAGVFPLSFAQESLWIEEQIGQSSAYSMPEAWRLRGQLDVSALREALARTVQRHETLRTVFRQQNGVPVQVVFDTAEIPVVEIAASCREPSELDHMIAAESRKPFDLKSGPLLRVNLFRKSSEDHILLINSHHLISDAWSQALLIGELAETYSSITTGSRASLPELPIQFADYAVWQRETFSGSILNRQIEYWQQQLSGSPRPATLLPDLPVACTDRMSQASTTYFELEAGLVNALSNLSRAQHTTLFTTLLAAFNVLLHRHTGEEDITIGAPIAGRERIETERLIGLFVNTHALRTRLGGNTVFSELLKSVRVAALGALANQYAPLSKVVAAVQPERDGGHPLFRIVFGLQSGPAEDIRMTGLTVERMELDNGAAKFDWTLLLTPTRNGISVRSELWTGRYKAVSAERLFSQYQRLLGEIVRNPKKQILDYDLGSPAERKRIVEALNKTATPYDRDSTVHDCFSRKAKWHPDRIGLAFGNDCWTYADIERRATLVAGALQKAGIKPHDRVIVDYERSPDMIFAILGTLKAGGVYVPVDRLYPSERQALIARQSQAKYILSDREHDAAGEAGSALQIVRLASDARSDLDAFNPVQLAGDDPAYIMFTSGSTGMPKGAVVPHRAILRLVQNTDYVRIHGDDVFLQFAPIAFDASTFEIWGALLNGARLQVFPPHMPSLSELGSFIKRHRVTVLWLTAGLFDQMVDHEVESLSNVRELLTGGEALSVPHVTRALRHLPRTTVINGYGPTENTTFSCCYRVPRNWEPRACVPIGSPIKNSQAYVLDQRRQLCPAGVQGELWVAGDGLALEYAGQAEFTAERFIEITLPGMRPQRMYRTGDRARWLEDGTIEFLGRIDSQLKIRGFRIEPGEIESVLGGMPGVKQAVVAAVERADSRQLVAYVVPSGTPQISSGSITAYASSKLPAYMVPSNIQLLDELPLTCNGKIDRQRLPSPVFGDALEGDRLLPHSEAERTVAAIWGEVLGTNNFDVRQNFFQLGGHSLLATQVASRLSHVLGAEVPVIALFENPTIQSLAAALPGSGGNHEFNLPIEHMPVDRARELLGRLDSLSEEEIEHLLKEFQDSVN